MSLNTHRSNNTTSGWDSLLLTEIDRILCYQIVNPAANNEPSLHELTCVYVSERVNEHENKLPNALKTGRTHVQNAVVCIVVERVSVGIVG